MVPLAKRHTPHPVYQRNDHKISCANRDKCAIFANKTWRISAMLTWSLVSVCWPQRNLTEAVYFFINLAISSDHAHCIVFRLTNKQVTVNWHCQVHQHLIGLSDKISPALWKLLKFKILKIRTKASEWKTALLKETTCSALSSMECKFQYLWVVFKHTTHQHQMVLHDVC